VKRRVVHALQKYLLNPPVRLLLTAGLVPPTYALLETRGRTTQKPRRTPVGNGLDDDTFWIVAEHGTRAGYVRNLQRDPHVRVMVREGLRQRWRTGTARVLPEDDPRERQRILGRGHPGRWLNAMAVRALGTDLTTIRISLDPETPARASARTGR
jgi:deazaflavin-dependent oxidoreductase (nitroreductase family)